MKRKLNGKSYVVMTYYQLMYSIMHAKKDNDSSILYISNDYVEFNESMIEGIRRSKIFAEVNVFNTKNFLRSFFDALRRSKPDVAFNTILENNFSKIFKNISGEHFYIFNEFQLYYYYVEKFCEKISIVEDGYNSYIRQNNILCFKGRYTLIDRYIGDFFPKVHAGSDKVVEYLVNNEVDELDAHRGLTKVCDFKEMEKKFGTTVLSNLYEMIFDYPKIKAGKTALLLTQPLQRAGYCNFVDQMKLYNKITIDLLKKYDNVYIKPHPADVVDYSFLKSGRVAVLGMNFPIEVYNYEKNKFDYSVSLASSANSISEFSTVTDTIFKRVEFKHNDVKKFIRKYVKKEKLSLLKISIVDDECNLVKINNEINNDKKRNKMLKELRVTSVIINSDKLMINGKISTEERISEILNKYDYNYVIFQKNRITFTMAQVRGINYFFNEKCSPIITMYSTVNCRAGEDFYLVDVDDTTHMMSVFNKIISKGYIIRPDTKTDYLVSDLRLEWCTDLFKLDIIKTVSLPEYYVLNTEYISFEEFLVNEINCYYKFARDPKYFYTLHQLSAIYEFELPELNIDYNVVSDILKNNTLISSSRARLLFTRSNSYLSFYYRLKIYKIKGIYLNIKEVRNIIKK